MWSGDLPSDGAASLTSSLDINEFVSIVAAPAPTVERGVSGQQSAPCGLQTGHCMGHGSASAAERSVLHLTTAATSDALLRLLRYGQHPEDRPLSLLPSTTT